MTHTPVTLTGGQRLSPMQRGLWMSQRGNPDAPLQNMALLTHIDGAVDADRLAAAFAQVVARSDALRTRIVDEFGTPSVRLASEARPSEVVQISRADVHAWARTRAAATLDLADAAYESVIVGHEDGTTSWFLNLHHTITDATSSALVFDATARIYHGEDVDLGSYYQWVRSAETPAPATESAAAHWRDRPRAAGIGRLYAPARRTSTTAARTQLAAGDSLAELTARASERYALVNDELTWTALLTTALSIHLHRVARVDEFAIGVPVHNRRTPADRALIGPMMEVFPVDVTIEPGDTHGSLHRRIGRSLMATLRAAKPGLAPAADYEAVVNVITRTGLGTFGTIPTTTRWIHSGAIEASHLLRLQLTGYGDAGHELVLDANEAVLGPAGDTNRAGPVGEHLSRILEAMVADADAPIGDVALCTPDELATLAEWERGPAPAPGVDVIAGLAAALNGDRAEIALEHGTTMLTGPQLWDRSARLARHLHDQGVGPGDRIGIELPRSADAVAAIVAVLMVGASFVPLDPNQPETRRRRLAERAGCREIVDDVPSLAELADTEPLAAADMVGPEGPEAAQGRDDLEAYCLFTSGSTGEPKGVPITRAGLAGYLAFAADAYVPDDRPLVAPLFGSLTFDLTITSLFLPLMAGGRLVVVEPDGAGAMSVVAERSDLTWCKATPSHLELLVRLLGADNQLATLIVGGEAFTGDLARRVQQACPSARIFNEYGPTEAVVGCMIHEFDPIANEPDVPIGVPAPGVELRIVDPNLQRTPLGAAGELCISHPGLTPGYLPPTTNEAFVQLDGRRFYRTGDLVRLIDRSTLVYQGRIDEQVKVGGIRLDPGEVEVALQSHPAIARAAVRVWSPSLRPAAQHCVRCGLPDTVPGSSFDDNGVCATCVAFERVEAGTKSWFGTTEDLRVMRDEARAKRTGRHDCLHLLSGGKDSTYALYRLVELGFEPYVLTLDNGFISPQALDNVRRTIEDLGLDHEFAQPDTMNEIFRDSLERFSNVCHGCYKTIYTLATTRADELGIPMIVTGLSRGQLFETRLIPQQFSLDRFDPEAIDRAVIEARKAYHRIDDGPRRLLDTTVFDRTEDDGSTVFDRVSYVDLYRYLDVPLSEMLSFLDDKAPWVRPTDTGRSTNCRINDAGIHTHLLEQGFHNYAIPYAWDVRLGHKTRDESMEELDDRLDPVAVADMLSAVGYQPAPRQVLTAWFELADDSPEPSPADLRSHLAALLPAHAVPSAFVAVPSIPLGPSGKVEAKQLPAPQLVHRRAATIEIRPRTSLEELVIATWERVLGVEPIGVDDNFFALGGDSLGALETVIALGEALDRKVDEDLPFLHPTPTELALALDVAPASEADQPSAPAPPSTSGAPALSDGEQAMLFEARREPESTRYNVGHRYRLAGELDRDRFTDALIAAAARHDPLRWSYAEPRQRLEPTRAVSVTWNDGAAEEADIEAAIVAAHRAPFDLTGGPLLRCLVQRSVNGDTIVLIVVHHISADAGGLRALWRQIDTAYRGDELEPLATDLAAFAAWQHETLPAGAADFWLSQDRAAAPWALQPPAAPESDGFIRRVASFSPDDLRTTSGTSASVAALAALATTLRRRTDGDAIGVGLLASTRNHPAAEPLVGYLLNTLPLTLDVQPGASFDELCSTVGSEVAGALRHRTYPYASIVADRRGAGGTLPSTEILFAFDELTGLEFDDRPVDLDVLFNGTAVGRLTFFVEVRADRVDLAVEHRGTEVNHTDAATLLAEWDATLARAVTATAASSSAATPGALATRAGGDSRIFGADLAPSPVDVMVPIRHHLANAGPAIAVDCGEDAYSWEALGYRSAQIARAAIDAGVSPGDRVIVSMARSVDLVAAIVATLRIGASYVPIDPSYPAARQRASATQSGAAVALVDHPGSPVASGDTAVTEISVAAIAASDLDPADLGANEWSGEDGEAYVIFTSGSTGTPRGVPVSRAQLAASNQARLQSYSTHPGNYLLLSSVSFDSSVAGLFWTLTSGGTVVLPTDAEASDPEAIGRLLNDGAITHTLLVPTLYRALLDRASEQPASAGSWPEVVVVAGEACPPSLVTDHLARRPHSQLFNEYGPTEATVWATVHPCTSPSPSTPIGRPIPGTWLAVVDEHDHVRPDGVAGELIIGGAGVVHGYLDDPDRTATRFGRWGRERYFRTGDRAVVRDGVAWFLGRVDNQLNVGGVRVEPEDIERVIESLPGVAAAIVHAADPRSTEELLGEAPPAVLSAAMTEAAAHADPLSALRAALATRLGAVPVLIAHVEPARSAALDPVALRRSLADLLPAGQRPGLLLVEQRLPRSPNGKLDRDAIARLPLAPRSAPVSSVAGSSANGTGVDSPPASDAEAQAIAAVFAEVLRLPEFPLDASFFDLGGHSLLALILLDELEDQLGIELTVAELYRRPTPAAIAETATSDRATGARQYQVTIQPEGTRPLLVGVHVLGSNAEFYRPLSAHLGIDQPVIGLGLAGAAPDAASPHQVIEVSRAYADELDETHPGVPLVLAAVSLGSVVTMQLAHELQSRGRSVPLVVLFDAAGPDAVDGGLPTGERLRLHLNEARRDPGAYVRDRTSRRRASLARRLEMAELAVRQRIAPELPDRLRVRQFVEQNVDAAAVHQLPPFAGRLVVFKADDDVFTRHLATQGMGWGSVAAGSLDVVTVPGGHLSMLAEPHVETLAREVARAIDDAEGSPLLDRSTVEQVLRTGLAEGSVADAITSLQAARLAADGAALLDSVQSAATTMSVRLAQTRRSLRTAFETAGLDAAIERPAPFVAHPTLSLTSSSDPTSVAEVLVSEGFEPLASDAQSSWRSFLHRDGSLRLNVGDLSATSASTSNGRGAGDLGIFLATPPGLVAPVLELAEPTGDDFLIDLGCGDGRVLIEAVRRFGCRARGVELDSTLVERARRAVQAAGLEDQIDIVLGDANEIDVADASIVFAFLPPASVNRLLPAVLDSLGPAGRFVTHEQLRTSWTVAPTVSRLLVADGITVGHCWTTPGASSETAEELA